LIGQTVAHYEVLEKIGAGGMGVVYRARDTKLDRDVALKVLPENFSFDEDRLARFDREAKLLATLNHAHIGGIYGIEHWEGKHLLVLELVEGEDLSERLAKGAVPVDETLEIALQISEALEAAHDQGIVHRDLKPANIKVTPEGTVKVLDFGLAKTLVDSDDPDLSKSPTMLTSQTMQGVILGTAGYMSPEQARGKPVDRRADIFAFGCILYEMLTAQRSFTGETLSDTLASVLKESPSLDPLPRDTPAAIKKLIARCLDKNPRQRLRDIGEARILLDQVIRGEVDEAIVESTVPAKTLRPVFLGLLGVVPVAAAILLTVFFMKSRQPEPPLRKFRIPVASRGFSPKQPTISPDGMRVAYVLNNRLAVQPLDDLQAITLDTEGTPAYPFWSPDGTRLGYFAAGGIFHLPATGGASVLLCNPAADFSGGTGGTWTTDGRIIFGNGSSGLMTVPVQGGDEEEFLTLEDTESDHHEPFMLPGDRGLLFLPHSLSSQPDKIEVYANGERKVLLHLTDLRLHKPRYSDTGHILFERPGANAGVWALPFSLSSLEATGSPFIVAAGGTSPSIASDGTLVYLAGDGDNSYVSLWLDRDGTSGEPLFEVGPGRGQASFSPNGERVVITEYADGNIDLWIYDLMRQSRMRFTFDLGRNSNPIWSSDGQDIYYWLANVDSIYRKPADGTGSPELVVAGGMPTLSPDMKHLVFMRPVPGQNGDIFQMNLETQEVKPIIATPADEDAPAISPAGGFMIYDSNESGGWQMYITSFPGRGGKWQVSRGNYSFGTWGADGSSIHYSTNTGDIMEVQFRVGTNGVELGTPTLLFSAEEHNLPSTNYISFQQSPNDPDKFLMMRTLQSDRRETNTDLTVVENWFREFQER
jgi:hypothetical protein